MQRDVPLREHLRKSAMTAIVVGTILCLVNHSYLARNLAGIALNYAVPLIVSTYAKLTARGSW